MNHIILLDSGPLGLLSNPRQTAPTQECRQWLQRLLRLGLRILVPEIADYEVRRELFRANKPKGLSRLDDLGQMLEYLPLNTAAMRKAAEVWAKVRQQGKPTAGDQSLDGDAILAGQALTLSENNLLVATTNARHLSRLVAAKLWTEIVVT